MGDQAEDILGDLSLCQMMMMPRITSWYRKSSMTTLFRQETLFLKEQSSTLESRKKGNQQIHSTWSETAGIRSANCKLSEKLQLASELTIDKAVKLVRQSELVRSQQQVLRGEHTKPDTPVEAVVRGRSQTRPTPSAKPKHREPSKTVDKCNRCGRYSTHDKDRCPARDAVLSWALLALRR